MRDLAAGLDLLLRGRSEPGEARALGLSRMLLVLVLCAAAYGAVMGSSAGRLAQAGYSAIKVPLLLLATSALVLPSFFVLNTLLGLRDDFGRAVRAVLAAQGVVAVALLSAAPLLLVAYASFSSYPAIVRANALLFGLATLAGHVACEKRYRDLVTRNARHQLCRYAWTLLYVFVGIQLAWVLRPFVGDPARPVALFREGAWSNAYVIVLRDLLGIR